MLTLKAIAVLLMLALCCLSPGALLSRRWRLVPLERLCVAVGLSLLVMYLLAGTVFLCKLDLMWYWLVPGVAAGLGIVGAKDLWRLVSARQVRAPLAAFGLLLVWCLLLLGLTRNYSGGGWCGDWLQHYARAFYYLNHMPPDWQAYGSPMPSRPPMQNVLSVPLLAIFTPSFELLQVIYVFLNSLVFLPCCLIARALVKRGGRSTWLLAVFFAASPLFAENATYTWTKLLPVFYVVLAFWLYLAGARKGDSRRIVLAFVMMACGVLVHFSTAPYLLFLAAHYVLATWRPQRWWQLSAWRGARWGELGLAVALCVLVLASWFAYALVTWGPAGAFKSNTSVTSSRAYAAAELGIDQAKAASIPAGQMALCNAKKVLLNIYDSIVPHPLRSDADRTFMEQESRVGYIRDYTFLIYQTNLILAMGVVGGGAAIWLMIRGLLDRFNTKRERLFWLAMVLFCTPLGVATIGERDCFGLAHICQQPIVLLSAAMLAATFFHLPRWSRLLLIAGLLADFAVGVLLQFHVQNEEFRIFFGPDGQVIGAQTLSGGPRISGLAIAGNAGAKASAGIHFVGDHLADYAGQLEAVLVALFLVAVGLMLRATLRRPTRTLSTRSMPKRKQRSTSCR